VVDSVVAAVEDVDVDRDDVSELEGAVELLDELVAEDEELDELVADDEALDEPGAEDEALDELGAEDRVLDELVSEDEAEDELGAEDGALDELGADDGIVDVAAELGVEVLDEELDDNCGRAWYMFNLFEPPQYWRAFALQTILHPELTGALPAPKVFPQ
jgi:hypothetical protein